MNLKNKHKVNYGNEILNDAYEKFITGERITYEEFVIMLSTNDELYFGYKGCEYQFEHTAKGVVSMCVSRLENNKIVIVRNEQYNSIIDVLNNFEVDGKKIREFWDDVQLPKWQ